MTEERIVEIEKVLSAAEKLGDAEEQLLLVWLEETDRPIKFEHDGFWHHDHVMMSVAKDNRIIRFTYSDDFDIARECDKSFGEFTIRLFNWEFHHPGVSWMNEEMWYSAEWDTDEALSLAIDARLYGNIPHVEEFASAPELTEYEIRRAFKSYLRHVPWRKLNFSTDATGAVYVYAIDENELDVNRELECALSSKRYEGRPIREAVYDWLHSGFDDGDVGSREVASYEEFCRGFLAEYDLPNIPKWRERPLSQKAITEDEAIACILKERVPFLSEYE